jgi:hypothetical protein
MSPSRFTPLVLTAIVAVASGASFAHAADPGRLQAARPHSTAVPDGSPTTYLVTPVADSDNRPEGGTFSPATPQVVAVGSTANFSIQFNPGYQIQIVGCGSKGTWLQQSGTFTTSPIESDCTLFYGFHPLQEPAAPPVPAPTLTWDRLLALALLFAAVALLRLRRTTR